MAKPGFRFQVTKDFDFRMFEELKKRVTAGERVVSVGLPAGKKEEDGTPLAMIGAVHEFGSPERGIPERSWLRSSLADNAPRFVALNRINLHKILLGEMTFDQALAQLGEMAKGAAQARIYSGPFADLQAATLRARARKRSGGYNAKLKAKRDAAGAGAPPEGKPLVDTGNLVQSITYIVGDKE